MTIADSEAGGKRRRAGDRDVDPEWHHPHGSSTTSQILTLLIVALIFGVLNAIIKPIFALVTIPLLLLTLGLFLIVINACMLLLTSWLAGLFDLGWHVDGFWTALLGAIIISIVSFVLNVFLPDPDDKRSD